MSNVKGFLAIAITFDPDSATLHTWCNDAESFNRQLDDTRRRRRAQGVGSRRQLSKLATAAMGVNVVSMHVHRLGVAPSIAAGLAPTERVSIASTPRASAASAADPASRPHESARRATLASPLLDSQARSAWYNVVLNTLRDGAWSSREADVARRRWMASLVGFGLLVTAAGSAGATGRGNDFDSYDWTEVTESAPWAGRAGLEAAAVGKSFFVLGGRSPNPWVAPPNGPLPGDSTLWGDVWRSDDRGASWTEVLATDDSSHWPARAYHEVVTRGRTMFLLGGQNISVVNNPACGWFEPCGPPFFQTSTFFNDVWSSKDGVDWELLTADAPWAGRAGLSAIVFKGELYVMGGSYVDDPAIGGTGERVVLNDVWKSRDGVEWEQLTDAAPWAARAGAAVVEKDGYLYLLGGEFGFVGFPPPYFNDVWRTRDGANWELVTESAGWSPRPGHTCDVLRDSIVCFGGFGQSEDPTDPFAPANPMDVWVSQDGADWVELSGSPWDAADPGAIKYDYDTVVAPAGPGGRGRAIYTFGGDRETFDFFDPTQWLNVDDDVWRFSLPKKGR